MNDDRRGRRPWGVIGLLAGTFALIAVPLGITGVVMVASQPVTPSASQVQPAHAALHDIGQGCLTLLTEEGKTAVRRDVTTIIAFAKTYPDVRFPIDDEHANGRSLLLVTKQALLRCNDASAAEIVTKALSAAPFTR